jgi:hypothetical protein
MNAYAVVFKPARAALTLLALSVAIAFIVVIGLARYRTEMELHILKTEQQLTITQENIRKLTFDLDEIHKLTKDYRQLIQLGFIGKPDRDGWVQDMETIYRDTHLPPTLRYTLAPPQLLNTQAVAPDSPMAYRNQVMHHDLNMELSGIHEGEFLELMASLSTYWKAPYRIESCQITRGDISEVLAGLKIKCLLQLYSLPVPEHTMHNVPATTHPGKSKTP